ncbi:MAG: SidA/IucD/PvdA family monooxygenase [Oligoflexia bacterium]|nr:SidA/IucD/PvdA family monooxygenase [Oligoflexia bacterium]
MNQKFDLLGIGIGPFNLSLATLLEKEKTISSYFLEKKEEFSWHPEMMFDDSTMQTSYLKDLATPVDPTSSYTFLNYLAKSHLFYQFMNTQRSTVTRKEFEKYCSWVTKELAHKLQFGTDVYGVEFKDNEFHTTTNKGIYQSKNICVATGLVPRIPDCVNSSLGEQIFHVKSPEFKNLNLDNKSVMIVGGGQTGVEVFRNTLNEKWGRASSIQLVTRRKNLEPLDESAFTNEYFTPAYFESFWNLPSSKKDEIVKSQKFASDGNTPSYLLDLYRDLYFKKSIEGDDRCIQILPCRNLSKADKGQSGITLELDNSFTDQTEKYRVDVVILCTGFENRVPKILEPLQHLIEFDQEKRFQFEKAYSIKWVYSENNKIYALNFSRHNHGIIDPQTSLMAWRSATVVNDLAKKTVYQLTQKNRNFIEYDYFPEK